jgi:hypothetical protein
MTPQEFSQKIRAKYPGAYDSISDIDLTKKVIEKYPTYASQVKMENQRDTRISQGLPVSSAKRFEKTGKAEPSFGGNIARYAVKPFATIAATATSGFRAPQEGEGSVQARPMKSNYLGDVKPLQAGLARGVDKGAEKIAQGNASGGMGEVVKGILNSTMAGAGTALEVGSFAVGAKPFTSAVRSQLKNIAKTEGVAGLMSGVGSGLRESVEEEKGFEQGAKDTLLQGGLGGLFGVVGGPVLAVGGRTLGKAGKLLTGSGRKDLSEQAIGSATDNLKELFATNRGKMFVEGVEMRKGDNPFRLIVESGAMKKADVSNNRVDVSASKKLLREDSMQWENLYQDALKLEPRRVTIKEVLPIIENDIMSSQYTSSVKQTMRKQAIKEIMDTFDEYGSSIDLSKLNEIKRKFWNEAFDGKALTDMDKIARNRKYTVGRALMKVIEDFSTNPDIKKINSVLGDYAEANKVLDGLSKQILKKGQLGRYSMQGLGAIAGMGGGPIGSIFGALGGDVVTNILQKMSVNNPMRNVLINYTRKYRPDLKGKLEKYIKETGEEIKNAKQLPPGPITVKPTPSKTLTQKEAQARLAEMGALYPAKVEKVKLPKKKPAIKKTPETKVEIKPETDIKKSIQQAKQSGQSFDEWVKGQGVVSKELEPIAIEARKYKSAEEFTKSLTTEKNGVTSIKIDLPTNLLESNGPLWDFKPSNQKITEPILVAFDKGKGTYTVVDGHHRLSQALVNNQKTLPSRVVFKNKDGNFDKFTKSQLTNIYDNAIKTRSQLKAEWDKVK